MNAVCLTDENLRAALSGDDASGDHLADCADCRRRFKALAVGETNWLLPASCETPPNVPAALLDSLNALADTGPARETVAQFDTLEELFPGLSPADGTRPRIGPYELHTIVGRGGMGVVIQGYDTRLERSVALKIPAPHLRTDPVARGRFIREGKAVALLTHPNVLPVFAVDEYGGVPVLVMPYVVGESLQQRIDREGKMTPAKAVEIVLQVAQALEVAHARGLVHRDVKPANVLLDAGTDHVHLTDFGLARAADDARLTQTGVGAGTPTFMAPEQARGDAVDHRADLFSLGSLLFTLLAGRPPFGSATTLMGTLRRIADGKPDSLRSLVPDLPRHVEELVMDLLKNDPAARPQTATAVVDRLRQCQRFLADGIDRTRSRKRHLVAAAVVIGGGLTALAAGTVFKFPTPEGTLIVEVDDPDATVTFDQDGKEVTVTAGSVKEFKMKLGKHAVTTTTPAGTSTELVEITRGGKRVVTARFEPKAVAAVPNDPPPGFENLRPRRSDPLVEGPKPPGYRLRETQVFKGHTGPVRAVAVTPDGKRLISSTSWPAGDGTVRVWDTETGDLVHTLRGHTGDVPALVVSKDGKHVLSGGSDGLIVLWDIAGGKEISRTKLAGKPLVISLAISGDGRMLAVGLSDSTILVLDTGSNKPITTLTGHTGRVRSVAFSPVGGLLLSGAEDGTVRAWDVAAGKLLWMRTHDRGWVEQVAFTAAGRRWLAVDRKLTAGDVGSGREYPSFALPARMEALTGVTVSPDERTAAVTAYGGWVAVVPFDRSLGPTLLKANEGNANCVTFSPDGKKVYVGGGGVYDPATKHYEAKDEVIREYRIEPLPLDRSGPRPAAEPKR